MCESEYVCECLSVAMPMYKPLENRDTGKCLVSSFSVSPHITALGKWLSLNQKLAIWLCCLAKKPPVSYSPLPLSPQVTDTCSHDQDSNQFLTFSKQVFLTPQLVPWLEFVLQSTFYVFKIVNIVKLSLLSLSPLSLCDGRFLQIPTSRSMQSMVL